MRLTQEKVKELLEYKNGNLIWKIRTSNRVNVGDIAGGDDGHGYIFISVLGKRYQIHRVIWLWHYGYLPENDIDHIDRNKVNNKVENLREVTRTCNLRNSNRSDTNVSGVRGVVWDNERGRWLAHLSFGNKSKYLGRSTDLTEAVCLRYAAEQCLEWSACDSDSSSYQYLRRHNVLKES